MPLTESAADFVPATQTELARKVAENAAGPAKPVYTVGGRTALHVGYPPEKPGMSLVTTELTRVIDYPARDMTITVEAGIRIDELTMVLARERQRLAVDAAQPHRATLGGVIATNTSGPRRFGLGTIRDYVIGLSAVDASGRLFKSGGRVVKNVAGYDLCKMLIGSLGTLAIVTQVTLKLRPLPEETSLLWASFDHWRAIDEMLAKLQSSATRPVAIEILEPRAAASIATEAGLDLPTNRPVICLGVEGFARETRWQLDTLQAELAAGHPHETIAVTGSDAARLWFALTEFEVPSDEPLTFKAGLLPSQTVEFVERAESLGMFVQAHAGNGIVHGHIAEVDSVAEASAQLQPLVDLTRRSSGHIAILHCEPKWKTDLPIFGDSPPSRRLMHQLKRSLDPRNLLNPGRLGT